MKDMNDSSRNIAEIIGVSDGIAFQTDTQAPSARADARAGERDAPGPRCRDRCSARRQRENRYRRVGVVLTTNAHRLLAWLLLAACSAAQAGRPLATEDADVLERGACEWESFAARQTVSGAPAVNGAGTQVGCGVGWNSQVALGYARERSAGASTSAWGLSGKTAIIERDAGATGFTLAWGLGSLRTPGGSMKHESSFLTLVATREWAGWLTHANLGWERSESASMNTTTWNLAVERPIGAGVDLMAEVYGDDRSRPWLGTGVRWTVNERFSVNASWSVQRESPRPKLWTLGFKLGF
jgi:hypothetical protein